MSCRRSSVLKVRRKDMDELAYCAEFDLDVASPPHAVRLRAGISTTMRPRPLGSISLASVRHCLPPDAV